VLDFVKTKTELKGKKVKNMNN